MIMMVKTIIVIIIVTLADLGVARSTYVVQNVSNAYVNHTTLYIIAHNQPIVLSHSVIDTITIPLLS